MNKTLTYSLFVFIAGGSYGFIVPVVKIASANGVQATEFLSLQYLIAFIFMAIIFFARRDKGAPPLTLGKLALVGFCTAGCSLCYYQAVAMLPGSVALTLMFQYIWVDAILDCVVHRSLPNLTTMISIIAVAIGGAFAAGIFDGSIATLDPIGVVFGLLSAVLYGLFLFIAGRVGTDQPIALRTMMLALGGFVLTSAVNPEIFTGQLFELKLWPYAIALAALGVIIPTNLISISSPKLSPSMVSIMAASELPLGVLAAWIIVNDVPSTFAIVGVVLVLLGIVINQLPALMATAREALKKAKE